MEKITYNLTLDDCRDYVKFQRKIPRIKKRLSMQFRSLFYLCIAVLVLGIIFELVNFGINLNAYAAENSVSMESLLGSENFNSMLGYSFDHFLTIALPVILLWLVIYLIAAGISKYDLFHAESSKVFDLMKSKDLDVELNIEEDGLFAKGRHTKCFTEWSKIVDIYDTGKSILVFVSDYSAIIVPKRAFELPEEAVMFFNTLKQHLDKK